MYKWLLVAPTIGLQKTQLSGEKDSFILGLILCKNCISPNNGPIQKFFLQSLSNPILHTAWLESHALTVKNNTAKYYFGEKSSFLHTFLKFSHESRTIKVNF